MGGDVVDLSQPAASVAKEVEDYMSSLVMAGQTVLQWWAAHQGAFPSVAVLAREYLSIAPTEVCTLCLCHKFLTDNLR